MSEVEGIVVIAFGAQGMDFLSKACKLTGRQAVLSPDVARMAGANFAIGNEDVLAALGRRLEAGALLVEQALHPTLAPDAVTWLAVGRRGTSSNTMFTHLTGVDALGGTAPSHPHDPADFDRCLGLLEMVPALRSEVYRMATVSPQWARLVDNWEAIEVSHLDEVGLGWTKGSSAPRTHALMSDALGLPSRAAGVREH